MNTKTLFLTLSLVSLSAATCAGGARAASVTPISSDLSVTPNVSYLACSLLLNCSGGSAILSYSGSAQFLFSYTQAEVPSTPNSAQILLTASLGIQGTSYGLSSQSLITNLDPGPVSQTLSYSVQNPTVILNLTFLTAGQYTAFYTVTALIENDPSGTDPSFITPASASTTFTTNFVVVPEPSSVFGLLGFGAIGGAAFIRRRVNNLKTIPIATNSRTEKHLER